MKKNPDSMVCAMLGRFAIVAILVALPATAGADFGSRTLADKVYTLYRNNVEAPHARTHVATFDADADAKTNRENCEFVTRLYQAQPGVNVKYWCEKGYYRREPKD
jgi:hypothetical protein